MSLLPNARETQHDLTVFSDQHSWSREKGAQCCWEVDDQLPSRGHIRSLQSRTHRVVMRSGQSLGWQHFLFPNTVSRVLVCFIFLSPLLACIFLFLIFLNFFWSNKEGVQRKVLEIRALLYGVLYPCNRLYYFFCRHSVRRQERCCGLPCSLLASTICHQKFGEVNESVCKLHNSSDGGSLADRPHSAKAVGTKLKCF